jgi:hypothetical protein
MAYRNVYASYKRDTNYLVYWVINVSNRIVKKLPEGDERALPLNTTGRATMKDFLAMSKLIASHNTAVPEVIFRLLRSVIDARTQAHEVFEQMAGRNPDPELARSNASHKHFIDVLVDAFGILGGEQWEAHHPSPPDASVETQMEELIFANKFAVLSHGDADDGSDGQEDSDLERRTRQEVAPARRRAARPGRRNNAKHGKKRNKTSSRPPTDDSAPEQDLPLESFRIIQDFEEGGRDGVGLLTDYLILVFELFHDVASLRAATQRHWKDVAYDNLNGAVAGALSNVAVKAIKNIDGQIFVDFPGNDSFRAVYDAITRGDPDRLRDNFSVQLYRVEATGERAAVSESVIDIEEQFLFHAYRDLRDFLVDFQMNRTGKPTKRMASELRGWDPTLDLGGLTKEERIRWRRVYTISWLYDLVNLFSSVVVQRITMKGENHDLATVDWSPSGPWGEHRRLYGLNEFAGFVTSLAMQRPGFDNAAKIRPHHVFQLQCMVDAMAVSRGWSICARRGHVLCPPPAGFSARRDVDLFLDRLVAEDIGILQGHDILKQLLDRMAAESGDKDRFWLQGEILQITMEDLRDWLGESKYMSGLKTIPPSRFSSTSPNGLWEYSPFLCGVGLLEGLEISYSVGAYLWENLPDATVMIHMHNMMVERGLLPRSIGLWGTLAGVFRHEFFGPDGPPKSDFLGSLRRCSQAHDAGAPKLRSRLRAVRTTLDIPKMVTNVGGNSTFRQESLSRLLREADWDVEGISVDRLRPASLLGTRVLARAQEAVASKARGATPEEVRLLGRARDAGYDGKPFSDAFLRAVGESKGAPPRPADLGPAPGAPGPGLGEARGAPPRGRVAGERSRFTMGFRAVDTMLALLREDLIAETSGEFPILGLSYAWLQITLHMLYSKIEEKLKNSHDPIYEAVFRPSDSPAARTTPRSTRWNLLLTKAMAASDEGCLKVIADCLWENRVGIEGFLYWKKLDLVEDRLNRSIEEEDDIPSCTVM